MKPARPTGSPRILAALAVGLTASGFARAQVSGTWNTSASGSYATASNWTSNPVVPGNGGVATFGAAAANLTVTLNASASLRGIVFDNAAASYTLAAGGTSAITLVSSVTNDPPLINVVGGTHTINAPFAGTAALTKTGLGTLVLGGASTFVGNTSVNAGVLRVTASNALGPAGANNAVGVQSSGVLELANNVNLGSRDVAVFTPASAAPNGAIRSLDGNNAINGSIFLIQSSSVGVGNGSTLTLGGDIIDAGLFGGSTLAKVGPGTLDVKRLGGGAGALGGLAVDAGVARVKPNGTNNSTSRINALSIASGAMLDLTDNALVIDYGGSSPIEAIRASLSDGRLTSMSVGTKRIGYAEAAALSLGTFAGQTTDATTLVARAVTPGDADLSGSVDFDDLLSLAQHYGSDGYWSDGDFDYSGRIDFDDLLILAQNYGAAGFATDIHAEIVAARSLANMSPSFTSEWNFAVHQVPEPIFALPLACLIGLGWKRSRKSCAW